MNAPTLVCISAGKFPRIDFTITHCVNTIEETIASIRQNPALGWRQTAEGMRTQNVTV
jgi:hypothetical protein